ncbi:unnamed protein product [Blepharisma stoltei]|uniref:cAMP-dependent protein kinase catalytic subunit n=1 Tax=Blepharisma stoltei TaxID=1481888 RepID=A0AAU9JPJ5_9CILI|nr:unnamed protein product [Blepharisma stoltei]
MEYKVSLSDIDILHTLGKGAYGRVRLGFMKSIGEYVAVKIIKKATILQKKEVEHIVSEFTILKRVNHPFIINFKGFNQDTRYLYFVLEFIPGGDLFKYLRTIGKLENTHACIYAAQMISALQYLHQNNIVYRDLKPENILIDADGYLRLTDFGFAKVIEERTYTLCGTPEYLAPEVILNKGYDQGVDWWTIGVLIFELLAGVDPFNTTDPSKIYRKILKGKIRYPKNFNPRAKNLVKHLVTSDTAKRYKINDIKNHAWFEDIDWNLLYHKRIGMPYIPVLRAPTENINFGSYPDSDTLAPAIATEYDPFIDW